MRQIGPRAGARDAGILAPYVEEPDSAAIGHGAHQALLLGDPPGDHQLSGIVLSPYFRVVVDLRLWNPAAPFGSPSWDGGNADVDGLLGGT